MKQYDYIFAGAGLSSLMTVYKMVLSHKFQDKTILLIDFDDKKNNDRTWCFWDRPNHFWHKVVSKSWSTAVFANKSTNKDLDIKPYLYHMIRGIDFYKHVFELINQQKNI